MKIVIDMDEQMYNYIRGHYTVIDDQFLGKGTTAEKILDTVADDQILGIFEKKDCKDCLYYLGEEDHPCDRIDCNIVRMRIGIDEDNGRRK